MKRLLVLVIFLTSVSALAVPSVADVDVHITFPLPPPMVFKAPPDVIVLPDTDDVYVVPDIDVDFYFWDGWWWRPWEGRWYRSRYYDRGWAYFGDAPDFYFDVDPGWRRYYRDRKWNGHRWKYERIRNRRLQQNWKTWHKERHWRNKRTWGVRKYTPLPEKRRQEIRLHRREEYRQRPEVRRYYKTREQPPERPGPREQKRRGDRDRGRDRGRDGR